jgi:diadenosine tetraphosphate (Ap4A) HIT family hydrolase
MRTKNAEKEYKNWRKKNDANYCPFCNKDILIKEFDFWIILKNRFPYTNTVKHYLLSPKRHIKRKEYLTEDEKIELEKIERELEKSSEFSYIRLNFHHKQSIPDHMHYHLILESR